MRWQENSSLQMNAAESHRNLTSFVKHSDLILSDKSLLLKKFLTKSDHSNMSNREGFMLENYREGDERRMCILDRSVGNGGWSPCTASAADTPQSLGWQFWLLHDTGVNRLFFVQLFVSPLPLPPAL